MRDFFRRERRAQDRTAVSWPGLPVRGHGRRALRSDPAARALFQRADDVLGCALSGLCFEGPEDDLNDTANAQPAIYAVSMALWQVLAPRLEPCARASPVWPGTAWASSRR